MCNLSYRNEQAATVAQPEPPEHEHVPEYEPAVFNTYCVVCGLWLHAGRVAPAATPSLGEDAVWLLARLKYSKSVHDAWVEHYAKGCERCEQEKEVIGDSDFHRGVSTDYAKCIGIVERLVCASGGKP